MNSAEGQQPDAVNTAAKPARAETTVAARAADEVEGKVDQALAGAMEATAKAAALEEVATAVA